MGRGVDPGHGQALKITRAYPGRPEDRAGDVIHSINGYLTEQPSHLAWIIANFGARPFVRRTGRSFCVTRVS